jgi:peptide/nickel transport system substrate-binding protein
VRHGRWRRWVVLLGVVMIAGACGGGEGGGGGEVRVKEGGTLDYAADQEPTGFNSNTSKDNGTSVYSIVIGLYPQTFHARPDYSVRMDAAFLDSAELTSTNPQTVVYRIKPDAAWSDGTPITADDFRYLWRNSSGSDRHIDVATTAGYDRIKSVTGSDGGKTVTVVFEQPFADWRSLFGNSGQILPSHYVKRQPGGWNTGLDKHPERIPSGGPFKVERYRPGESLTLVRNDRYYGLKAHLDRIVFRFLPESTTQPAALQNNEVGMIYPQPQLDQVQQVKALPDVTSEINFGLSFEHLDFNIENRFLADLRVRQAIATGLDRQQLLERTVKQFSDKATVLGNRIWLTGQPQYEDHFGQYGKGDVAGAQRLLEQAGFSKGADGIYAKGGKRLSLRLSTTTGNALRETQEQLIQAQMKQVGIDIRIANADNTKLFGDWLPNGNFDIANFAWVGTPFAVSSNQGIYMTGQGSNYGQYSSAKVDALFERGLAELDPDRSAAIGNQIDRQLTADMATIPLYQKPTFIAYRNTFVGIGDNATSEGPFWNAGTWGMRAQ